MKARRGFLVGAVIVGAIVLFLILAGARSFVSVVSASGTRMECISPEELVREFEENSKTCLFAKEEGFLTGSADARLLEDSSRLAGARGAISVFPLLGNVGNRAVKTAAPYQCGEAAFMVVYLPVERLTDDPEETEIFLRSGKRPSATHFLGLCLPAD